MPSLAIDRSTLQRTIAVANGKGGIGKTSIATNIAGLFAEAGHKVLLIDLDPQGNAGLDLGYTEVSDEGQSMAQAVVVGGSAPTPIHQVRPDLDVVPAGRFTKELVAVLQQRRMSDPVGGADALVSSIARIAGGYHLTILDCPPGEEVLVSAALTAARWVLVPTKTDDGGRGGLRRIAEQFTVARMTNPELELLGVVLFGVNRSARRVQQRARELLAQDLGGVDAVLETTIRHVEAAATEARGRGQLIHELERDVESRPPFWQRLRKRTDEVAPSPGEGDTTTSSPDSVRGLASDYQALAEELLNRIVAGETHRAADTQGAIA